MQLEAPPPNLPAPPPREQPLEQQAIQGPFPLPFKGLVRV